MTIIIYSCILDALYNPSMPAAFSRSKAILQATFVTLLWSTSWVLIKIGLHNSLPAITFAGLRYTLAFLCLVPFVVFNQSHRYALKQLTPRVPCSWHWHTCLPTWSAFCLT